jgi:hypothetical protein
VPTTVNHEPHPHAPAAGPHPAGGWIRPLQAGGRHDDGPDDDGLVHLAGLILTALAVLTLATGAALIGLAAYAVMTWRRTRWWPPVLLGLTAALVTVAILGGPGPAVHHHLTALRQLAGPHPDGIGALIAQRLPVWLLWQVPLGAPLGLIGAGLARHRVTHQAAHDLSPSAQARRRAEHAAQERKARRKATAAPLEHQGRPVLGAWIAGDLAGWRAGEWCTLPDGTLGLGTVVLGLPGTGKTETLLRLAQLGLARGFDVHVIDAKGDPGTQARFAAIAEAAGHEAILFPQEPYDGWRGDPTALRNRLGRIVDYTEPYYQDGTRVLLDDATRDGAQDLDQLIARFRDNDSDVDHQVRKGAVSRYRSFSAAAGKHLCGRWAFEDTHASYLLLDGVALGDDTPRLARYLLEDFQHYAAARKPAGRKALLIVDEFSALRVPNAAALLERLRSFGVGVVIASQSVEGLHDDPNERARLLGAATTVIAHRLADPEPVAARAGTVQRAERSHQLDHHGATGMGSLRIQETYRIDPNDLRNLPPGVAWITTAGRAAKVAISRGGQDRGAPRGSGAPKAGDAGAFGVGTFVTMDGPDEISFFEAVLAPAPGVEQGSGNDHMPSIPERGAARHRSEVEQQVLPMDTTVLEVLPESGGRPEAEPKAQVHPSREPAPAPKPPRRASPYAENL